MGNKYDKISYRIGVEVENILIEPEGDTIEASTRAEIVKRLLSETKKIGGIWQYQDSNQFNWHINDSRLTPGKIMIDKDLEDIEQTTQFGESKMMELLRRAKKLERKTCFVILGGLDVGSVVNIDKPVMVIGRGAGCDLILRDHDISRRHVEVRLKGSDSLVILDLGSTNGTFIDGKLITEATLREGEKVLLGRQTVLKFVLMDELEESCQKQTFESSTRDTLTGIFNRKYLSLKIVQDIALAKRHSFPISLLMVDIDHFKNVNDTYGHSTGDHLFQTYFSHKPI